MKSQTSRESDLITPCIATEKRREERFAADDTIRWKRPGRIEDYKAWMLDRSESGLGFLVMVEQDVMPHEGEVLNLRRFRDGAWETLESTIRVARTTPLPGGEVGIVGCTIQK